jgi:hypothetical protein
MQLGTRWTVGSQPPTRLSQEMLDAIAAVETSLGDAAAGERWTLTWLEGHPVAELPVAETPHTVAEALEAAPSMNPGPELPVAEALEAAPEVTIVRESHDGSVSTYTA